ncbi:MAG TPA: aspartate 1-decarboxylase [Spirochaetota bacterium]|nr:aspartate 1-decarboxylase [Spirochaetota bacterium]
MLEFILKAKIHRCYVTEDHLDYEGSITIGQELLQATGIKPLEKVEIYNVTNGNRFSTYVIKGKPEGKEIIINGAAAHLASKGDILIIAAYCLADSTETDKIQPRKITVTDQNNNFK